MQNSNFRKTTSFEFLVWTGGKREPQMSEVKHKLEQKQKGEGAVKLLPTSLFYPSIKAAVCNFTVTHGF